jgi:hypothetical protein
LQVRQATQLRGFGPLEPGEETLAILEAGVAPGSNTVNFQPDAPIACASDRPLVLVLEPAPGIAWSLSAEEPPGTQAGGWDVELGYWRWFHGTLAFDVAPVSSPYGAASIVSGINRPEQATNMWVSDPAQPLPQSITLTWPEPVEIGRVEVTFDSQLSGWVWEGPFSTVVRDYEMSVTQDGQSTVVAQATGNHQRRRVHDIEPTRTSSLTLTVNATNGIGTARVVEIRAYPPEHAQTPGD